MWKRVVIVWNTLHVFTLVRHSQLSSLSSTIPITVLRPRICWSGQRMSHWQYIRFLSSSLLWIDTRLFVMYIFPYVYLLPGTPVRMRLRSRVIGIQSLTALWFVISVERVNKNGHTVFSFQLRCLFVLLLLFISRYYYFFESMFSNRLLRWL